MPIILIIDDYDMLLDVMRLALEDEYLGHTARNGQEALGLMELVSPDVVITDMDMPEMTGLDLIKAIHRRDAEDAEKGNDWVKGIKAERQKEVELKASELGNAVHHEGAKSTKKDNDWIKDIKAEKRNSLSTNHTNGHPPSLLRSYGGTGEERQKELGIKASDLEMHTQYRQNPKIILYSARMDRDLREQARELGVAACMDKPFELEEMREKIREILENQTL
jgi:CheY-like chemotaxis protein